MDPEHCIKPVSCRFWKTLWNNDHNILDTLAETIKTKPKHTPFAIELKSKNQKNSRKIQKILKKCFGDTLKLFKGSFNYTEGPKQMHIPCQEQHIVGRAKGSHNGERAG